MQKVLGAMIGEKQSATIKEKEQYSGVTEGMHCVPSHRL